MTARLVASAVAAAAAGACGGSSSAALDASVDGAAAAPACTATFREDFAETWAGPANCAGIDTSDGHTTLRFTIPSQTIAAPFEISIDLGAAGSPGTYTARSLATPWNANALHEFDGTSCLFHAGTAAVPPGTFRLVLDELDPVGARAHGSLEVTLYVLARPYTDCGPSNIERLAVRF